MCSLILWYLQPWIPNATTPWVVPGVAHSCAGSSWSITKDNYCRFFVLVAAPQIMWKTERVEDPLCPGNFGVKLCKRRLGDAHRVGTAGKHSTDGKVLLVCPSPLPKTLLETKETSEYGKTLPEENKPKGFYTSRLGLLGKFPWGLHTLLISSPHANSVGEE